MRLRLHIPKLKELALYTASYIIIYAYDRSPRRPIPHELYLQCLAAFIEKYSDGASVQKIYYRNRRGGGGRLPDYLEQWRMSLGTAICMADHLVFDDDGDRRSGTDISDILEALITKDAGDDDVVQCIHRLFSLLRHSRSNLEPVVDMMGYSLHRCSRSVREELMRCGASLDYDGWKYLEHLCRCGVHRNLKDMLSHREHRDIIHDQELLCSAVESGDVTTVEVVTALTNEHIHPDVVIRTDRALNARDFTVPLCERLLSLGVLRHGQHLSLDNVRSLDVMQWLIQHDVVRENDVITDVIRRAVYHGGKYVEILRWLVEGARTPLCDIQLTDWCQFKSSVFQSTSFDGVPNLQIYEYLIQHGASYPSIQRFCLLLLVHALDGNSVKMMS